MKDVGYVDLSQGISQVTAIPKEELDKLHIYWLPEVKPVVKGGDLVIDFPGMTEKDAQEVAKPLVKSTGYTTNYFPLLSGGSSFRAPMYSVEDPEKVKFYLDSVLGALSSAKDKWPKWIESLKKPSIEVGDLVKLHSADDISPSILTLGEIYLVEDVDYQAQKVKIQGHWVPMEYVELSQKGKEEVGKNPFKVGDLVTFIKKPPTNYAGHSLGKTYVVAEIDLSMSTVRIGQRWYPTEFFKLAMKGTGPSKPSQEAILLATDALLEGEKYE